MNSLKISIITVVYNAESTIAQCVESVLSQEHPDIEYIVVDGNSKDNTINVLEPYRNKISHLVSEPDKGLYDAMNKGIRLATGDIVGILNADDFYASNQVLNYVNSQFTNSDIEGLCTDVAIYKNENFTKPFRYYSAQSFSTWQFIIGIQPPHPGFFVKKNCYDKFGLYDPEYRIAGDFELLLRFIKINKIKTVYNNFLSVKMRDGGLSASGFKSKVKMNKEDLKALKKHGIFSFGLLIWTKYIFKLKQLF
ncbi:MAG: glycosyltransferase [Bacteroidia bacterium]|nr:glycosyltransferase [Bacteroidia bacterium]